MAKLIELSGKLAMVPRTSGRGEAMNAKRILRVTLAIETDIESSNSIGITAKAEIKLQPGLTALFQTITSGGYWGIDRNSDSHYIGQIEQEQLSELCHQLRAIGFSQRAITAAFRNVTRRGVE